MKKTFLSVCAVSFLAALYSCADNAGTKPPPANDSLQTSTADTGKISGIPCDITIANIHFTKSINGADTLVTTDKNGKTTFTAGAKKDFFIDPNNQLSNNTAPLLLAAVDNTKPFTLVAKVTPQFTTKGLYNAGVLYLYSDDALWQKHCFEQDERGKHRIVTVRTMGTSDDNNHDIVESPFVYMKISSDAKTVANYYSLDKKEWHMVRLYKNNYPAKLWVGISTQCPVDTGTLSHFEDLSLDQNSVSDFRMGD